MTIIAIDGPAGSGKSTLAHGLAAELGLAYVNTGVTYRAVAAEALRRGVAPGDADGLAGLARDLDLSVEGTPPQIHLDGRPPGEELVAARVEAIVSEVSRHPRVREALHEKQRVLAGARAVVEGRDIGTVVFPEAELKIFLEAAPGERAARRLAERETGDPALAEALERRDEMDARTSPLVPAPDAVLIDTTGRDIESVLAEAVALARRVLQ